MKQKISVVIATYNEVLNIEKLYNVIKDIIHKHELSYEFIVIDNRSEDGTIEKLKAIAKIDINFKVIINRKNFGQIRSPFYAFKLASGDCALSVSADFQDPPELIDELITKWKKGADVVMARKLNDTSNFLFTKAKKFFYYLINKFSDIDLPQNTTGSGIYSKSIINEMRKLSDPYPYFRGMVSEITDRIEFVDFVQPKRLHGHSKTNIFSLYDIGILGFIKHTKLMRPIAFIGFFLSFISIIISISYLILKILNWDSFSSGIAPVLIGMFFIFSVLIFFLGLLGEYLIIILNLLKNTPLVFEEEKINFDKDKEI
tara:strand:+ start:10445 stop:11389 length:945 start_codon:yes stop_codon:yes gene_type:complete